jgi:thioredoxin 1
MRLMVAVALILLGILIYRLVNGAVLTRARKANQDERYAISSQYPAILYFTTPDCTTCKMYQRPQLRRLPSLLRDDFPIIEVNASERPEIASQWGVLSVPTTIILDHSGVPRHANYGAVRAEKLAEQVRRVLESK